MLKQYKVEIFSQQLDFKGFASIERPDILFDYLSPEKNKLKVAKIDANKGDFVHATSICGDIVSQGIITDIVKDKDFTIITYLPLISIFDTDVSFDRTQSRNLETFLSGIITAHYITVDDAFQKLPLEIAVRSSTQGKLNLKDNIHNLLEIILKCFNYGVVVNILLIPGDKKIRIEIENVTDMLTLESKIAIDKNIVIGDSYGALNKMTLVNKKNESQKVTYYLHPNGEVNSLNEDRLYPVFFTTKFIDNDNFFEAADDEAKDSLKPKQYNNLIELLFANNSKVIQPMKIGTKANIDGLESVFTGYEKSAEMTRYIFGVVRVDLTKILKRAIK